MIALLVKGGIKAPAKVNLFMVQKAKQYYVKNISTNQNLEQKNSVKVQKILKKATLLLNQKIKFPRALKMVVTQ